jgi:hypothetical protein
MSVDEHVAAALSYSMCRRYGDTIQVHRLVQTVIASRLSDEARKMLVSTIQRLLVAAAPDDADAPSTWARWSALGPHLLVAGGRCRR